MFPTLVHIGPIPIRSYGLMLAIGFVVGIWLARKSASKYGFDKEAVLDIGLIVLACGLLGARIGFVFTNLGMFNGRWIEVFQVWSGGLSFHGGLLGGLLGGVGYAYFKKVSFWNGVDLFAPPLVIAYAITRIGCFLNGCCYGSECSLPWGVRFPDEHNPGQLTPPSHPAQLYATLINIGLFFVLSAVAKRRSFKGQVFAWFLILHGAYRFILEFIRAGATSGERFGWVTDGHIVAIIMIVLGGALYLWKSRTEPVSEHRTITAKA